ncbi:MAG: response regulator [Anaerolineales bacterium]|jgi:pilus assembly protein CpaE
MPEAAESPIRVLIVDDIAETRDNIRKLLQFEVDIEVVGAARTGGEALQLARDTNPDVVLMDINMPDMDGITATEAILADIPFAQIVILSVQSDADYMRRAMLAGARDFIPKPPSGDELVATIRLVSKRAREQREKMAKPSEQARGRGPRGAAEVALRPLGHLLAVYSAKGGVGCTTLATNFAIGLASEETPTVLVDTSMQFGDVSVFLNLQPKTSIVDLAARAEEIDPEVIEDVLLVHESGLRVLPAPPRPEMADEIRAEQVRRVLQSLKRMFTYVLVDTGSAMDDVTLAVLDTADLLIAVASPDIPSIKDARQVFDLLDVLEFPKERVFFIINKMDRHSGITVEAIADNLKHTVRGSIPTDERVVAASINRGVPLLLGDRNKQPAKSILTILNKLKKIVTAELAYEGET